MEKTMNHNVSIDDVLKAFAKNPQIQDALTCMKAAMAQKDGTMTFAIKVNKDSIEMSLKDGEEQASIFEGEQPKEVPLRTWEVNLKDSIGDALYTYLEQSYTNIPENVAEQSVSNTMAKIFRSIIIETDGAVKDVWQNLIPKKGKE